MGGVVEKTMSTEEKQSEQQEVADKTTDLKESLLSSLDLPEDSPTEEESKPVKLKKQSEEPIEEPEEEQTENTEESEEESQEEESEEEQAEESSEDEESVPKSKYEKALKEMQRRIDSLTAKVKTQESKTAEEPKDSDIAKLEKMSDAELKDVWRKCRVAQAREQDDTKLAGLVELEEKISSVMKDSPQRFANKQIAHYSAKADEIMSDPEISALDKDTLDKASKQILSTAKNIYSTYPELQKQERGQAIALQLAFEHYKEMSKLDIGKSKVSELKQKVNQFKRKTALDSSAVKNKSASSQLETLRKKAFRGGDLNDKLNLVKNDPSFNLDSFIPDEFKER